MPGLGNGRFDREAGVDVRRGRGDALAGRQLGLELGVDDPLERDLLEAVALLVEALLRSAGLCLGQVPRGQGGVDAPLRLVEAEGLDGDPLPEVVDRDRLAVHAAHRLEVVVVVGQAGGDRQDDDRQQDDQAEAEVQVEVPSVLCLPRGSVGALDDGLGSEGHG